ncbi:MAG TPA: carbohydrate porin [Rhodanobacteraceae bacterium]
MRTKPLAAALAATLAATCLALPPASSAATGTTTRGDATVAAQLKAMQAEIDALKSQNTALQSKISTLQPQLDALAKQQRAAAAGAPTAHETAAASVAKVAPKKQRATAGKANEPPKPRWDTATTHSNDTGITVGGAVRFQYTTGNYDREIKHRHGDMQFDIFRLDLDGKVHGILLSAQWRWFTYMSAMQHAWIGYDLTPHSRVQVGLTRIPFGNQPFDSHSYFFSSNYYLGLEDTYGFGAEYIHKTDRWNLQAAFFKNDATGSVGASTDRTNSYSYDVVGVRKPGEPISAPPSQPAGAINTAAVRVARIFAPAADLQLTVGASALYGAINNPVHRIGRHSAYALNANVKYGRWNFQAQASRYAYDTYDGATAMAVGAYAFYDTIAARANTYTANVAYHLPFVWGPFESMDFYNDYSLVTGKSGNLPDTFMDVLGMGLSAGDLYTYFDFVTARNQPFIGGSMAGDGKTDHRLNINFGFYF